MNENNIFKILNSKWTMLIVGIVMIIFIPTTYGNVKVLLEAGAAGKYWYLILVFVINVLGAIMALYKFASIAFIKKEKTEW
jgi:hypothetical protein